MLNAYKIDVSLVARILQPSDDVVLLPSLEELKLLPYDPPELTWYVAHDEASGRLAR